VREPARFEGALDSSGQRPVCPGLVRACPESVVCMLEKVAEPQRRFCIVDCDPLLSRDQVRDKAAKLAVNYHSGSMEIAQGVIEAVGAEVGKRLFEQMEHIG